MNRGERAINLEPSGPRPQPWRRVLAVAALAAVAGCAHIHEATRLRVQPLEPARTRSEAAGRGYQISATRQGQLVQAQVMGVARCQQVLEQRARGFRRTIRRTQDSSLTLEWLFGGLFSAAGASIVTYAVRNPAPKEVEGEYSPSGQRQAYAYGAAIGLVGVALLVGATWQQLSLGVSEVDLGERMLKQKGRPQPCGEPAPAPAKVRLTLGDGLQLEADAGADGLATFTLPEDIEQRLRAEGRRGTLEVKGDWRSQVRIRL
mgnify:CR=1 FL=1